jgi:MOSC domain-containing protein YiiM
MANVKAISISDRKGVRKNNIDAAKLIVGFGLENDAHAGDWHRQVSLLAEESIDKMRAKGLDVVAGNFAENITTIGIDLESLEVGQHFTIGEAELIISQLGKICHTRCAIYHQAGDCVMPREGVFAVVRKAGSIVVGDSIALEDKRSQAAAIVAPRKILSEQQEAVVERVTELWSPAFIRVDPVTKQQSASLQAILDDLTKTQKIHQILIFDPEGELGFQLCTSGYLPQQGSWTEHSSTIFYAKDLEEVKASAG